MTKAFLWLPLAIIAVPWGYVFQNYVMWSNTKKALLYDPVARPET